MLAPLDRAAVEMANALMDRLRPLDTTILNARGFRAMVEDLHERNTSAVGQPHNDAIHMAHAAMLRAAIGTIMAALDKPGRDRASVGQMIYMFELVDLSVLADRWPDAAFGAAELQRAKHDWATLLATPEFQDCKDFRDGAVAHTLVTELPTVPNEAYFRLHDAAEQLALRFFRICGFGKPAFSEHGPRLTASAKMFWDTYWKGMASP